MRNRKVKLRVPIKPIFNTRDVLQFATDAQFKYTGEQPVKCLQFACGKTLSAQERVYGDRCIAHQSPPSFTSLVEGYI